MNYSEQSWWSDCVNRGMSGSVKLIKEYLKEVVEVNRADKRMKVIDRKIREMSIEERALRRKRINLQRKVLEIGSPQWAKAFAEAAESAEFNK
jgi:hypothetical protein